MMASESFQIGEHTEVPEGGVLEEGLDTTPLPPYLALCTSSMTIPGSYPF